MEPASAVNIVLDFSHDSYFATNSTAMTTLTQAATDVSDALTTTLAAVSTNEYTGTDGSTTATVTWKGRYSNPADGTQTDFNFTSIPENEFRIFVGMRGLSGSTLGVGGVAGAGFTLGGSGFDSQWVGVVANMETASNAGMTRSGLQVGEISGSSTLGSTTANYDLSYGFLAGSLAFDNDTNNNGTTDSAAELDAFWHFDGDTPVAAGKSDFYSVAVHEMMHAIGFGGSDVWDANLDGPTNWTGSEVIDKLGTGTGVVEGGAHVASGTTGIPLIDGTFETAQTQEAIMDPTLTVGTRKHLTDTDLAFMRDMGFEATIVPEPASTLLLLMAGAGLLLTRPRRRS